jgi:hypothetical protein
MGIEPLVEGSRVICLCKRDLVVPKGREVAAPTIKR